MTELDENIISDKLKKCNTIGEQIEIVKVYSELCVDNRIREMKGYLQFFIQCNYQKAKERWRFMSLKGGVKATAGGEFENMGECIEKYKLDIDKLE